LVPEARIKSILEEIERLREQLQQLVEEKESLQNPEIQAVSQAFDVALNEYLRLLTKAKKD
jgi:regulator of replication initiation timing